VEHNAKIYVAGHTGLIGTAIISRLKSDGYTNIITHTHKELDLTRQSEVEKFFQVEKPSYVILCAAKVGGIHANSTYPAQFIYENLAIQLNVIHLAYLTSVKKLLFFGSACSYPRECLQPMKEEYLFTGLLEPTNEPYAVAKIAGIKMCQAYNKQYGTNFICAIPTNVYGPNDNFDSNNSHVIPALIRKFYEAKEKGLSEVTIWGTGEVRREFIYVDDIADACLYLMEHYNESNIINIGVGEDISIKELAHIIREAVGYSGDILFDKSEPDGVPKKMLDVSRMRSYGWHVKIGLKEGISLTYEWCKKNNLKEFGQQ
jgi:GDP-L-fucose synthase